jgi:hypothetical protein
VSRPGRAGAARHLALPAQAGGVTYALHVAKVVFGIAVAGAVGFYWVAGAVSVELFLPAVGTLLAGLWLAVHGLFTGIEAAVASGRAGSTSGSGGQVRA